LCSLPSLRVLQFEELETLFFHCVCGGYTNCRCGIKAIKNRSNALDEFRIVDVSGLSTSRCSSLIVTLILRVRNRFSSDWGHLFWGSRSLLINEFQFFV
jgi:hypothetical protein